MWENQWQDNWVSEYVNWVAPHPGGAASHKDPDSQHGPERGLSHLPDAEDFVDFSNPPVVNS